MFKSVNRAITYQSYSNQGLYSTRLRSEYSEEDKEIECTRFANINKHKQYVSQTGWNQFEARLYNGRIDSWMTIDPAGQHVTPYLAMSNTPNQNVDPDGRHDTRRQAKRAARRSGDYENFSKIIKRDDGQFSFTADGVNDFSKYIMVNATPEELGGSGAWIQIGKMGIDYDASMQFKIFTGTYVDVGPIGQTVKLGPELLSLTQGYSSQAGDYINSDWFLKNGEIKMSASVSAEMPLFYGVLIDVGVGLNSTIYTNDFNNMPLNQVVMMDRTQQSMESLKGKAHLGTAGLRFDTKNGLHVQEDFVYDDLVNMLGGDPAEIKFTRAKRPRTNEYVDVCERCESKYGRDAFTEEGTKYKSDR